MLHEWFHERFFYSIFTARQICLEISRKPFIRFAFRWTGNSFTHLVFNRIRAHTVFFAKNAWPPVWEKKCHGGPRDSFANTPAADFSTSQTFDFDLSVPRHTFIHETSVIKLLLYLRGDGWKRSEDKFYDCTVQCARTNISVLKSL